MAPIKIAAERNRQFLILLIVIQMWLLLSLWLEFVALGVQEIQFIADLKVFPYVRTMEVTAYTAGPESTGKEEGHPEFGVTASTHRIAVGAGELCIAGPPDLDFGTRIFVPGYGTGVVKDRGELIQGDRLDVYYDDLKTAKEWGRRQLAVIVFP